MSRKLVLRLVAAAAVVAVIGLGIALVRGNGDVGAQSGSVNEIAPAEPGFDARAGRTPDREQAPAEPGSDARADRTPARERKPALVWAVGDGADGGDEAVAVASMIASERPDRFLYLGDVYEEGTAAEFRRNYRPVYGRLDAITAPTPGNHDWPNAGEGYNPYWREVHGRPQPSYYSFRTGGWEIVSLNSEGAHDEGSRQLRWLRHAVSDGGNCRLAFLHRPRFSAGRHGDQEDVEPLWRVLRGNASIVVGGHDHTMQRFHPIDGITQFVSGAGGKSHYGLDKSDRRLAFGNNRDDGALRLELRPGAARWAFVSTAGRELDAGSVKCSR